MSANRQQPWWAASSLADIDPEELERQCGHLHSAGPLALHEFVRALLLGGDILITLEDYHRLDRSIIAYLGHDRLPHQRLGDAR